ncbi:MAG: hypothetical protein JWL88_499 [Parcubacteria group bacterium]|nr:hypothetical protein [Parcubacteria group bacterium]
MEIEYEAKFYPVDKDTVRLQLKDAGAEQIYPEKLMRRINFNMPKGHESEDKWGRVRDEGGLITMSIKEITGNKIDDAKEVMLVINNFDAGVAFLESVGCVQKSFQETKRELWSLEGVDITIDEWPFIEPFVEVEGLSEERVREVSKLLGFDWSNARFCAVGTLYHEKYSMNEPKINNGVPNITFDGSNPFLQ